MAVTIAENEGKVWYEFGKFDERTYMAWIDASEDYPEICFSLEINLPQTQPHHWWAQLEVPLILFKRIVGSLEDSVRPLKLGDYGTFSHLANNQVRFTLPCGERHTFDLEDLLTLVDQL